MNPVIRCFAFCTLLPAFQCAARADDQVLKLVAARDKAVRAASLDMNKRLLAELDKLRIAKARSGDKAGLAYTEAQIVRVKTEIEAARQQPCGNVNPDDFRLAAFNSNGGGFLARPADNSPAEERPGVLKWKNTRISRAEMVGGFPLTGAFEIEIKVKGNFSFFGLTEAACEKNFWMGASPAPSTDFRTFLIKRTAEGLISIAQDGAALGLGTGEGFVHTMPVLLRMGIAPGEEIEIREFKIRDLSAGKSTGK